LVSMWTLVEETSRYRPISGRHFSFRPSHAEARTCVSPDTRDFGWAIYFDVEAELGAGVLVVYMTPFCYDRHSMGADLSGLPPKGGSQRVVVLAATASSQI